MAGSGYLDVRASSTAIKRFLSLFEGEVGYSTPFDSDDFTILGFTQIDICMNIILPKYHFAGEKGFMQIFYMTRTAVFYKQACASICTSTFHL